MSTSPTCPRCGESVPPGARFCTRCGNDISGEQGRVSTVKMSAVGADPAPGLLTQLKAATLGEFEIYDELGRGGMATVYLGHEIALDRKVAIKVMNPTLVGSGPQMVERFKREARTAASLSHPHIIPIYAVRETPDFIFFVMKFVRGRSLDAIIKHTGPLPLAMTQTILAQAGGAIDYAHRQGIIHRDIKPANIMLDEDGWAVVTDFGIAKVADAQHLTMTGVTVGTPTYMSPEQCAAKEVTAGSDQYSLGIVAYEMLTGRVPFSADTVMGVMWQHFNDPPKPIRELRPDCPPGLEAAVLRMLAKQPADRWPSVDDAVDAIGAPQLRKDDPIRRQMRALAREGTGAQVLARVHTPASPVPKSTAATPITPATPHPAREITDAPTVISDPGIGAEAPTALVQTPTPAARPTPTRPIATPPPAPRPAPTVAATPTPTIQERAAPAAAAAPLATPRRRARRSPLPLVLGAAAVAVLALGIWVVASRGFGGQGPIASADSIPGAPPPPAPVARVEVGPSPASIAVGGTLQLTVALADSAGTALSGREVRWQSADTTVVRVSAAGLVSGAAAGTATVTATSESHSATATVTVTPVVTPIASLVVTPNPATVAVGDTAVLVAAPRDAAGNTLGGRPVTWTASAPAVARVSAGGVVTALREGATTVTAAVEGRRVTVRLTVTPAVVATVAVTPAQLTLIPGGRASLVALPRDARGNPLAGRAVAWASSDEDVVVVTSQGSVRAMSPGRATISATVEGVAGRVPVAVGPTPVATVALASPPALEVGGSAQLAVTLRDAQGRVLADRPLSWASSDPQVATVSAGGTLVARRPGTATITATSEGQSARVSVTVTAPPRTDVAVTPPAGAPPAGDTAAKPPAPSGGAAGQPTNPPATAPAPPTRPPATTTAALPRRAIVAGGLHSCGITGSGQVACWGSNSALQLGDAASGQEGLTAALLGALRGVTTLAAGGGHTCALVEGGQALCWGQNRNGQLGGTGDQPIAVPGRSFTALTAGARHTCGIAADGLAWCWGDDGHGQLGDGSTRGGAQPRAVRGGIKFTALAAGSDHTCGLAVGGKVYCWGDGFSSQLGRGIREQMTEPVEVDLPVKAMAVAVGDKQSCILGQTGAAYCWGENRSGEVGDGSKSEQSRPVAVRGRLVFTALVGGANHTCGLTEAGEAYCWGSNRDGQLGDGTRTARTVPTRVAVEVPLRVLAAGGAHTCALTRSNEPLCWGANGRGQIGDGTTDPQSTPTVVKAGS